MIIHVLTLFPEMFSGFLDASIMKRARERGAFDIRLHNFRDHGVGPHQKVDDTPYGGGPGMVLKCEPIFATMREIEQAEAEAGRQPLRILLTPQGEPLKQTTCRSLARVKSMILLCGHYEGFDERIRQSFDWQEISLGDFVLTGGEVPAMALIDSVVRLLPGVLGDEESAVEESFETSSEADAKTGLLEYPHYTRPPEFEGMEVPDVLLSGHHAKIAEWRQAQAMARTRERRPDLLEGQEEE